MELIASKGTESKERSADIVLNEIIQIRRYSIGGYSIQAIAASSVTPSEQSHGMIWSERPLGAYRLEEELLKEPCAVRNGKESFTRYMRRPIHQRVGAIGTVLVLSSDCDNCAWRRLAILFLVLDCIDRPGALER
jgi:hypothetical protein